MKKKLITFLAICLTILTISLFPACGGSGNDNNGSTISGTGK